MTSWLGHERATAALLGAARGGTLHHAWLFAGPKGVGKAAFAEAAAIRLLADAVGAPVLDGLALAEGDRTRALVEAKAHPDFRLLTRGPHPKNTGELARNITVDQVRTLIASFATSPALSSRRMVVIDSIDEMERSAANALLKSLEEPPAGTVFLLVSHMPGRLLPTIRSRCRLLRFDALSDAEVGEAVRAALPDATAEEVTALVRAGQGSPGRALGYAGLDLAQIDRALEGIAADGDRQNQRRLKLSRELSGKAAQSRFLAFLERAPATIAEASRGRSGASLARAMEAYDDARRVADWGQTASPDIVGQTVFELAGVVARLAG